MKVLWTVAGCGSDDEEEGKEERASQGTRRVGAGCPPSSLHAAGVWLAVGVGVGVGE